VTANLHYGDNHTVTTDDPNEMRDFAGVAAEMTLLSAAVTTLPTDADPSPRR
jgi:hypothetical protein